MEYSASLLKFKNIRMCSGIHKRNILQAPSKVHPLSNVSVPG